jgi:hypothetical protein
MRKVMAENDDDDREIVYYYSRERRLERASPQVRELNETSSNRPGFIRRAAGNKGNIFLLLSIIMVCIMLVFSSRLRSPGSFKFGGNEIKLSITKNNGEVLSLEILKTIVKDMFIYTGAVEIAVSPVQKKPPMGTENPPPEIMHGRVFFSLAEEENFSFVLPFDGNEFWVILESEDERAVHRVRKPR